MNQTSKFSNTIHFKDHDDQIPATPPLPWNVIRPRRSYSSEMFRDENYPQHHQEERLGEWESNEQVDCPPSGRYSGESSGYHSGPPSKPHNGHKLPSAQRKSVPNYNSQSLTRSHPDKHTNKTRKTSTLPNHKNDQGCHNSSKPPKIVTRKPEHGSHYFVDY